MWQGARVLVTGVALLRITAGCLGHDDGFRRRRLVGIDDAAVRLDVAVHLLALREGGAADHRRQNDEGREQRPGTQLTRRVGNRLRIRARNRPTAHAASCGFMTMTCHYAATR